MLRGGGLRERREHRDQRRAAHGLGRHRNHRGEASILSVVVNFYNNRREAANTLYSLTRAHQRDAEDVEYEVIALDHGSTERLSERDVRAFGPQFSYRYVETRSVSPVRAVNAACRDCSGDRLLVIIDGAHILTPRVLHLADKAFSLFPSPFVATVPFHLGPKHQVDSIAEGYSQQAEDRLLGESGWRENGYGLYAVAGSYADASEGWFGMLFESGCFGMRKHDFLALGGFDERFQSRGGGLVNLDMFQRALDARQLQYVMLVGEATFHQFHGGVASNAPRAQHPWHEFHAEYVRIRGREFARVPRRPFFMGRMPREALHIAAYSAAAAFRLWEQGGVPDD